jgi:membrane protease YdiL (CAAX protease family)
VWPVFLVYLAAFVGIVAAALVAALVVHDLYPDLSPQVVLQGLPGLVAGGLASSSVLALTVLVVTRPFQPAALRLLPGRERGVDLAAMLAGTLALGQMLDSASMLAGVGQRGSMALIRRALEGAAGPELFNAVIVIGVMASAAEELFFRGYMQTRLRGHWPAWAAVAATSAAFALLHLEWLHVLLALVLGLYFGALTEMTGSALPAVACHVVNNVVFIILTALGGSVEGFRPNVVLLSVSVPVFVACLAWLRSSLAAPSAPPPAGEEG